MSKSTKFFQVTNQMLVQYQYNPWESIGMVGLDAEDSLSYHNIFLYKQLDGNFALLDNPENSLPSQNNNILNTKFPDVNDEKFYYLGWFSGSFKDDKDIVSNDFVASTLRSLCNKGYISSFSNADLAVLGTSENNSKNAECFRIFQNGQVPYDTIRVYLLTGFVFNGIEGMAIRVKAKTNNNSLENYKNEYVTLLNEVFFKDRLQQKVNWLPNPLYMNSKFYDRYIEIKVPDAYYFGYPNNKTSVNQELFDILNIDYSGNLILEFATISSDNVQSIDQLSMVNRKYDELIGTTSIELDPVVRAVLKPKSNSDLFNVRIYEDPSTHFVNYYPVFGEGTDAVDLSLDVMLNIENGRIPLIDKGFYDSNEGWEDFTEQYGMDACRWVVLNELSVTYEYQSMYIDENDALSDVISSRTEVFSNMIDYTNKTSSDGRFWRQEFIPHIQDIAGQKCTRVIIGYTCRLQNRLNGTEIIRNAGLVIEDADSKFNDNAKFLNVSNINKWKVVNRNMSSASVVTQVVEQQKAEKFIRSYYQSNDLLIQDTNSNVTATQGQLTLQLYKTTHNYGFRLFDVNAMNNRVPHDLSGPYTYKLRFPLSDGTTLDIAPLVSTSESQSNLGIGQLLFTVTGDEANRIMSVSQQDRFFAIICDNEGNATSSSVLYEGKVSWI